MFIRNFASVPTRTTRTTTTMKRVLHGYRPTTERRLPSSRSNKQTNYLTNVPYLIDRWRHELAVKDITTLREDDGEVEKGRAKKRKKRTVPIFDLPDGAGADEWRAESNPAETSEFSGDSGGRRRVAGHGIILLLMAFGQGQDDLLFFQIGSVRAEALATQMEAITANGH